MKLNIKGLDAVRDQLKEVAEELQGKTLAKANRAAFKKVAEAAKSLVPVDTGDLRDAISIKAVTSKGVVAAGIVFKTTTTKAKQAKMAAAVFNESQSKDLPPSRRWHFIETGTAKKGARPFLRPALDSQSQAVIDDLGNQLKKVIAAAVKKKSKGAK